MNYGYARVSTREQNAARQIEALQHEGVTKIYLDKCSGKDFNRKNYTRMLRRFKPGDVLYIKSIDRLGRNYDEILEQWKLITHTKNVAIVVLDMPLLDTRSSKDITGKLISDIVLELLSYVAHTEREFIRQRQREGIDLALARGVKFGRSPLPKPSNFRDVVDAYSQGLINSREAGSLLGVSHKTFLIWYKSEKTVNKSEH